MENQPTQSDAIDIKGLIEKAQLEAEQIRSNARMAMPENIVALIDECKSKGIEVTAVQIGMPWYLVRPLTRFEFLQMQSELASEASVFQKDEKATDIDIQLKVQAREQEKVVMKGVVYPTIDKLNINAMNAGLIDTLQRVIMNASGFNQDVLPIKM